MAIDKCKGCYGGLTNNPPEHVERWMAEEFRAIQAREKREKAEIRFADEA